MAASHGGQGSRGVSSLTQVLLCFGALLLGAAPVAKAQGSFVSVISSNANLTILREAVNAAGLTNVLSDRSLAYTLFAPTNDAFFGVLETLQVTPEELLSQPQEALQAFLLYHALPTVVNASSVPENATDVVTAAGPSLPPLTVQRTGAAVTVTSVGTTANVIAADLDAGDGIVHVVDNVLLPFYTTLAQAVEGNPELSTLYAALNAANLTEAFSDPTLTYTVFAPTDAAFARTLAYLGITPDQLLSNTALLTNVLLYHVLPTRVLSTDIPSEATTVETLGGETLVVQSTGNGVSITAKAINASVVAADIPVGVGPRSVVHVVDWAFVPFYPAVSSIAAANPDFSILTAAILAEGTYTPVITGVAPFSGTIFAPTNDAFTALLSALGLTAEQLLADTATLKLVLETHIVAGAPLTTDDLVAGVELTTINGQPLSTSYDVSSETLTVEAPGSTAVVGGRESTPTIAVFAIDTVLLPGTPSSPSAPGYGSYGGYGGYGGYGYGGYGYGGYGPYGFVPPPPPYGGNGGYGYGYYGSY